MAWVVDTSVLLDIRIGLPVDTALRSAECLEAHADEGLVVCPITFIEMAPSFAGDFVAQQRWLDHLGVVSRDAWHEDDTKAAHQFWYDLIQRKRQGTSRKRPIADVLIAAFSRRYRGLITANESDFSMIAPGLPLIVPSKPKSE